MSVTLTNTSGRMKTFVLAHETYCSARGECACTVTPGRNARRVASSLTLATGARVTDFDDAVVRVPEVARAARAGELRVEREAPPVPHVDAGEVVEGSAPRAADTASAAGHASDVAVSAESVAPGDAGTLSETASPHETETAIGGARRTGKRLRGES